MLPLFGSVDAENAPDALFQPSHLESFEKEHGRIEPGTIVLVRTGWGIFENVASMEPLPTRGALILALPMKIRGGSGGPLRIVAVPPPT